MSMPPTTQLNCPQTHSDANSTEEHNESRLKDDCDGCTVEDEDDSEEYNRCITMFTNAVSLFVLNEGQDAWSCLGMGYIVKIVYVKDIIGEAIIVEDTSKNIISNTLISTDAVMQCADKECSWTATDYACEPRIKRTLKTIFQTAMAAKKFHQTFVRGYNCALISNLRDTFELSAINYKDFFPQ